MSTLRELAGDAVTYHPSNSRTGLPEQRRPACQAIAGIALSAVRDRLTAILDYGYGDEEPEANHAGMRRVIELLEER